jgi:hypothetical protein
MSRISTSLHGRKIGLSAQNRLIVPAGFIAGEHGSQRHYGSPSKVEYWEDFLGDVVPDEINSVEGTDSATSDVGILAGGIGGVMRLTTGDAGTGIAADMEQITWALNWQASNGNLCFETRIKLSAITTCYAFVGFTDLVTFEAPIISASSVNTITTNASDAVGFMFDTNMSTDNWWLVGVAADVDATHQNTGYAPVAGTYEVLRVEINTSGVATFYRNGLVVGTPMTGALTAATDLTPTIAVSKLSVAASMTADVDYVHVSMDRIAGA